MQMIIGSIRKWQYIQLQYVMITIYENLGMRRKFMKDFAVDFGMSGQEK